MFFQKTVNDGSVPLEYKRGKRTKKEYRSKCLGYKFAIPEGFVLEKEEVLKEKSTQEDISDFCGKSRAGIEVGVNFIPADGSFPINDTGTMDMIGKSIVQKINDTSTDGRTSTYYGVTEFCGKKCAHSIMEYERDGVQFFTEFYQNYTTYYLLQFAFTYTYENGTGVSELRSLFSSL